jgi:uncharacterized protein (DUF433 family)
LIELHIIKQYIDSGVKLGVVVDVAQALEAQIGPHPFASAKLETEGKHLIEKGDDGNFYDRRTGQIIAHFIESFFKSVEFGPDGLANLWHPFGDDRILVAPRVKFGRPVLTKSHIPTRTLFDFYQNGDTVDLLSKLYRVPIGDVRAAIGFEEKLLEAA